MHIVEWVITSPPPGEEDLSFGGWKTLFDTQAAGWSLPVERAMVGGFLADRLAYAFAAGYQAALRCLFPALPATPIAALCITEKDGTHPRAIHTRLEDGVLNGEKQFVTHAREAEILLIAASTGKTPEGKNQLCLVRVDLPQPGVIIEAEADLPFVPEISHGRVLLHDAHIDAAAILPGDGYTRYIKPFRTVEDIHVFAALCAYLYRVGMLSYWEDEVKEWLLGTLATLLYLGQQDPLHHSVHLALAGTIHQMRALLADLDWDAADPLTRALWDRDRALLEVAEALRAKRRETAWLAYRKGDK